jgi:hypothetical protein
MKMNENMEYEQELTSPWLHAFERHLVLGQKQKALQMLDQVIEADMPLFRDDPKILKARRFAWLCRIELLRESGRFSEALAWTCLECELNTENVAAQALKERLKRARYLDKPVHPYPKRTKKKPIEALWTGVAGMREIKAILERDVILPLQEPELYKRYRVDLPNGLLFYGTPGCGKTYIARKLSEILKFEFVEVKPSDLYTAAELEHIINAAARCALEDRRNITEADILNSIKENPPSLSIESLEDSRHEKEQV